MSDENNDRPPESALSSRLQRRQMNAPRRENPLDLIRLFKVFKELLEIIKPPHSKEDIMRNRQYYLATHTQRYKMEEEAQAVQKWTKDSKEYAIARPCCFFVRDTESEPRSVDPDVPMPFEIKENWDREEATKRIKELFIELDEILQNKNTSNGSDEAEVTARLNLERLRQLRQQIPPRPLNFGRHQSEEDLSEVFKRTRML